SSRYLVPVGERLAPHYRVYAPDRPGFGKSDDPPEPLDLPGLARALRDFMDAVGVERAPLLGNSFGCQMIAEFAVRYPERVSHAILVGPTVDRRHGGALQQIARTAFGGTREAHSLTLVHFPDYAAAGLGQIWRTFQTMMGDHIEAKLPHVQAPTLVVRGTRDVIVSQEWAEQMARLLPRGRLALIPGAAHAINYSQPLELARVVMGFLAEERAG
ncbi:MAG: alpha/beta hydrolase, partial [Thermomicrobiaceae bacterium]|nr:alpha/beta hydrolase [Thermomicrobiaceae bacterium]